MEEIIDYEKIYYFTGTAVPYCSKEKVNEWNKKQGWFG